MVGEIGIREALDDATSRFQARVLHMWGIASKGLVLHVHLLLLPNEWLEVTFGLRRQACIGLVTQPVPYAARR